VTFILDDLLVRPFVGLLNIIHDMAIEELYDLEEIRNRLKETQLLYELGELDEAAYRTKRTALEEELAEAEAAHERLSDKVVVAR
jgi:hypothetical protein